MSGANAQHTSNVNITPRTSGPNPNTLRWSYYTGDPVRQLQASTVIAPEGSIYFGSNAGVYQAVHGKMHSLTSNGALRWMYDRDFDMAPGTYLLNIYSTPALGLYSMPDTESGFARGESVTPAPQYAVYFGCSDGKLRCLSSAGTLLWRSAYLGGPIDGGPVIGSNGRVYVAVNDDNPQGEQNIYCFDPNVPATSPYNKQPVWSTHVDGGCPGGVALFEQGSNTYLYIVGQWGQVKKMRDGGSSAVPVWTQPLNTPGGVGIACYGTVDPSGRVFTASWGGGTVPGAIFGLDANGVSIWQVPFNPNERIDSCTDGVTTGSFGAIEGFPGGISMKQQTTTLYFGTQRSPTSSPFADYSLLLEVQNIVPGVARVIRLHSVDYFDPTLAFAHYEIGGQPQQTLFFANEDGTVYMTDADGVDQWSPATAARMDHPGLALAADGTLYVGCNNGTMYAFWGPK